MSEKIEGLLNAQIGLLRHISALLEKISAGSAPLSPGYRRRLAEYAGFDWASIDAQVVAQDQHGAAEVEWNSHRFTRRSGSGKFGKAIWFSRPLGRDEQETAYARLITFKDSDAEPLASDLAQATPKAQPQAPSAQLVSPKAQPGQAKANGTPAPVAEPKRDDANTPTAFWSIAAALIQAGKLAHLDAGKIAQADSGTWAEKAARLLLEYGPLPEAMPN